MKITKYGAENDGSRLRVMEYKKTVLTLKEIAEIEGLSREALNNRINVFLKGRCDFDDILSSDFGKREVRTVEFGGIEVTYKTLMDKLGCKRATAHNRINKYKKGLISFTDMMSPINYRKEYKKAKFGSKPVFNTEEERKKINSIPSGGTWEEENLTPTTSSGGLGNGGLDCRLNLTGG